MAYEFKNFCISNITIDSPATCNVLTLLDGKSIDPHKIIVEMLALPEDVTLLTSDKGNLLFNLDIFSNVKIKDMFKIINKKIMKRKR